ncbi:MAG: colicin V production protein [Pseudomonadales bacterium]|nr:MAG: colicin V production protein [Pseudomonadales bacterium]
MNGLDIVILIFVVLGMWKGFSVGLIQSVVSIIGWLLALILGSKLSDSVAPYFVDIVKSDVLQLALGFLTIVLVVITILHVVAYILRSILSTLKLGLLDKMAGGVLGAGRNVLVVLVVLSVSAPLFAKMAVYQSSLLTQELLPYAPVAREIVEETFGEAWQQLDEKTDELDKTIDKTLDSQMGKKPLS